MRRRFAPLVCGFNPTDRYAARDIERTLDKYPFWRGIGEVLCRHDDLTNMTNEETARGFRVPRDPDEHEKNGRFPIHRESSRRA